MGTVSTRVSLDREHYRSFAVPLLVSDSGTPPMSATVTLTIVVGDLNDNGMKPGWKTVMVHTVHVSSNLFFYEIQSCAVKDVYNIYYHFQRTKTLYKIYDIEKNCRLFILKISIKVYIKNIVYR